MPDGNPILMKLMNAMLGFETDIDCYIKRVSL